jgi:hypothetical protein
MAITLAAFAAAGAPARADLGRLPADVRRVVRPLIAQMASDIRYEEQAPPLEVVPLNKAVRLRPLSAADPIGAPNGQIVRFDVEGLRTGEELRLVALLPVSGQIGWEGAKESARTNLYHLVIDHADGSREVLPRVPSEGLVTQKKLSLRVKPGKTTITFWADGSSAITGLSSGRMIELNYAPEH